MASNFAWGIDVGNRALKAVKLVRAKLEDFYATLSDEQKAQFEAIGPRRSA